MRPEEIRARRRALGWTQAQLAAVAGTTQQTVDRLERGVVQHARALPAITAALSQALTASPPPTPAPAASPDDSAAHGHAPRSPDLRVVHAGIFVRERLVIGAVVELLPPPPMLEPILDSYGIALESNLPPFRPGDVLWLNPLVRPRYGGPGLLFDADATALPAARARLTMSAPADMHRVDCAHRLVCVYYRGVDL